MNSLNIVTLFWGIVTIAFVGTMVYRATLSNHETDRLFLNDLDEEVPSYQHQENDAVVRRLNTLLPVCKGLGGMTAIMSLLVAGMWIAHALPSL
jgi:hypothetical protein